MKTSQFFVIMNRNFKDFFQPTWGLRQGNPLSPMLFINMEEVLTRLLKNNFEDGRIEKFTQPMGTSFISHLLYGDDLLIFVNGRKISIKGLMNTLATYEK